MTSTTLPLSLKQLCGVSDEVLTQHQQQNQQQQQQQHQQQQHQQQQQQGGSAAPLSRQVSLDADSHAMDNVDVDACIHASAQRIKQQLSSWQVAGDCFGSFKDVVALFTFLQRCKTWEATAKVWFPPGFPFYCFCIQVDLPGTQTQTVTEKLTKAQHTRTRIPSLHSTPLHSTPRNPCPP